MKLTFCGTRQVSLQVHIAPGPHASPRIEREDHAQIDGRLIGFLLTEAHEQIEVAIAVDSGVGWQS